ncbi:hypothetical protein CIT292_10256 [Citrobacter youngae ATCC 29220]|uniref:Uncharacterized protein n=1 Tax=Citrobacter youngae ATCC 29220 TaxID=500640 RepID=D4BI91_9ENTR|nr:hypothetical protein CIT292_10256 [Citrobacter youngae ATCC 29220]
MFFVGRIRRLRCHPATPLPDGALLIGPTTFPFLPSTDTNLLSGCKFSYSKIIKIGYVLAEYAAKARPAIQ